VLYRFQGGSDGIFPNYGDLIFDQSGAIYGVTSYGGSGTCNNDGILGCGTVYKLTASGGSWTESILWSFTGGSDGDVPVGGVIFDSGGNLYTTTSMTQSSFGGSVDELSPSGGGWTETTLYQFQSDSPEKGPRAGVIRDNSGNLYGTTWFGGSGGGIAFELIQSGGIWMLSDLCDFSGNNGSGPVGSLIMDKAGNLYGTAALTGPYQEGQVFKLTPSGGGWTCSFLHDFTGGSDGGHAFGSVAIDANGNLYGTTSGGGKNGQGVVWEITP
jgi:uncharacterized repeat protein (TIGR03803 family)